MSKLIGTNPNQVPSNADLGTAAFMDAKDFLTSRGSSLSAIDAVIPKTAVDVFIYDTSKDSDGGAWRKRTQHTTWYNERLNTTTRGSRAEFPAVAVIVAEANKVTIYDGADPSLPMWMVFNANGASGDRSFWASGFDISSLAAKNGVISFGIDVTSVGSGVVLVNFPVDALERVGTTSGRGGVYSGVSDRNSDPTLSGTVVPIVNSVVKDVAMTVLPDAPIDPATGLPVPTIAVATNGGVSVIRDDGTVVDLTRSSSAIDAVDFYDGYLIFGSSSVGGVWYYDNIPSSDEAVSPNAGHIEYYDSGYSNKDTPAYLGWVSTKTAGKYIGTAGANNAGLTAVDFNNTDYTKSSTAWITSSYNTGWMPGDIKLAALADTDATNVTGSELVTNGEFTTDLSGWSQYGSGDHTISLSSGAMDVARGTLGSGNGEPYQALATEVGKVYQLSFDVSGTTMSTIVETALGGTQLVFQNVAVGPAEITFTATGATTYIRFIPDVTNTTSTIDNVSVRLADPDRSVNGNGLGVHGSITKAPVATGADVVAYSGFSTSNYLEQPYNPDLNFGTGDFCVMGWVKWDTTGSWGALFHRTSGANVDAAGSMIAIMSGGNSTTAWVLGTQINFSTSNPADVWQHLVLTRRSGVCEVYLDGSFVTSASQAGSVTDTSATTYIGGYLYSSAISANGGNMALVRASATAPTADQIRKIYEDEKVLFQENAKATLTGTSDAVTSLAHDPDTDLLHVGTSGGRSVFQGLRRVEEHTGTDSQSLAAISAVDGLVVEGK